MNDKEYLENIKNIPTDELWTKLKDFGCGDGYINDLWWTTVEELEKRSVQQPCKDAIRREAAIDAMYHHFCDKSREECAQILHEVPSVTPQANNEDTHREREQAYMRGYEDASRKYRTEPCDDAISRQAVEDAIYDYSRSCDVNYAQIMEYIDKLPSVSTEKTDAYKQGWHDAICKALDEAYDIVIDGERFSVVQEETLIGVGMAYEQVTGRWIGDKSYPICSKCNCNIIEEYISSSDYAEMYKPMKCCPNCGCRMFDPQESEDKE